jgi:predicted Fe-S protein YdhL (DUF1289 family)
MPEKKCQKKCKLNQYTQICEGCGRTLQEIVNAGNEYKRNREEVQWSGEFPKSRNASREAGAEAEASGDGV